MRSSLPVCVCGCGVLADRPEGRAAKADGKSLFQARALFFRGV